MMLSLGLLQDMFIHGRGATTCSLYIQGNTSIPYSRNAPTLGRPGDARFAFGIFGGAGSGSAAGARGDGARSDGPAEAGGADPNPSAQAAVVGVYPYWDPKFGPATPATYAVGWHNISMQNVVELTGIKKGFALSPDGYTVTIAAALPRSVIPWLPSPLTAGILTGGDFSCNINGFQKDWWTNFDMKASQITWDEPTEASLGCARLCLRLHLRASVCACGWEQAALPIVLVLVLVLVLVGLVYHLRTNNDVAAQPPRPSSWGNFSFK